MSIGIFLAGRGGMIPQGSLAQELLPKELDGDKPSAESKGIWVFFSMARELLGVYHCGSQVPEVTWVGNGVFDTNRAALG